MSIDVNVQNDLVIVTESSEDITVNVSNAAGANGVGVPTGGTTGQVLKKLSNTNYDTYWALDGGGVPYSGATGQVDLGNYDLKVQGLTIGKGNNALVNNTALGHSTLLAATTGNFNTAVGYESLRNTTTGQYNTAVGQSSLFSNTTGGQNTALGLNALLLNTTGSTNVAVGLDTLQHITTGSSNTAIGYNAGSHITGGSTPNTTATNSVFIGRDSKAGADGQTNQIVIGQNAVGNGSNTATFGNTATTANYFTGSINGGSFVKSGGTSSQFLKADGSVDSSTYVGGSGATGQVAYWNGTSSQTGSANLLWDNTNQRLSITGQNLATTTTISAICASGTFSLNNSSNHYVNTTLSQTSSQGSVSHALTNNSSLTGSFVMYGSAEGNNLFGTSRNSALALLNNNGTKFFLGTINSTDLIFGTTNLERMRLFAGGNFNIGGTTDGGQRLQVIGDAFIKGSGATSATNGLLIQNSSSSNIFNFRNDGTLLMSTVSEQTIPVINIVGRTSPINAATYIRVLRYGNSDSINQSAEIFGYWDDSNVTGFRFQNGLGTGGGVTFNFIPNGNVVTSNVVTVNQTFNPTSGAATIAQLLVSPTINQTGGANGITRGLYINPTLTAAADWRSIEWSNNSGWGLYGAGTAANYLGGNLGIGGFVTPVTGYGIINLNGSNGGSLNFSLGGTRAALIYNDSSFFTINTENSTLPFRLNGNYLDFSTTINLASKMRLTNAGRLLLGTTSEGSFIFDAVGSARITGNMNMNATASAWGSNFRVIEMQGGGTVSSFTTDPSIQLLSNLYHDGSALRRITAAVGTRYYQITGEHVFEVTGSGAIGSSATMTTAMKLTNAGRLLLGTTTESTYLLDVNGTARVSGASTFGGNMNLSFNQNVPTSFIVNNLGTGTGSVSVVAVVTGSGNGEIGKRNYTVTTYKTLVAGDTYIYNSTTAGNISILNDFASGNINFAAGGSSTVHVTIKANGSVRYQPMATPASAEAGDVYYDSSTNKLRCYNGTSWNDLF